MFGHKSKIRKVKHVDESGNRCLKSVIEQVADYSRKHGHTADAEKIAIRLWTFVHGASSLQLDGDYERRRPRSQRSRLDRGRNPEAPWRGIGRARAAR